MAHPREQWTPVRFVHQHQTCDFCWQPILRGSPGSRVGDRGTRAWWSPLRRVWECLGCRTEGFRAEMVREACADVPWGPCGLVFPERGRRDAGEGGTT